MDVIVKWRNGTKNCVSTKELKCTNKADTVTRIGTHVKMYFKNKWYYGTVVMTEDVPVQLENRKEDNFNSSDDEPLINVVKRHAIQSHKEDPFCNIDIEEPDDPDFVLPSTPRRRSVSSDATVCLEDDIIFDKNNNSPSKHTSSVPKQLNYLGNEDSYHVQSCEVTGCHSEVFSSCFRCQILLCWEHFEVNDTSCENHLYIQPDDAGQTHSESPSILLNDQDNTRMIPEDFYVEGAPKEANITRKKKFDKKKFNKLMKDSGEKYTTQVTKKTIPRREIKTSCNVGTCKKYQRDCYLFNEEIRQNIFAKFWEQSNLQSQREYIVRHVQRVLPKRKIVQSNSRRQYTLIYRMPLENVLKRVCKIFFLNTLNITERNVRTALEKVDITGVVEVDKRGGRRESYLDNDKKCWRLIEEHIDRFPKVESHYCREKSTREYLNSDLTVRKMYHMFRDELKDSPVKPSLSLYRRVFKSKNLSFHRPKKDQCSLCMTFHKGSEEEKLRLSEKFNKHQEDKSLFRQKRAECKEEAKKTPSIVQCATFDLQQVINLPISNESAVFYKRRLSVYNFTIYDMATGECYCFTWHVGESKRGSCEISSALYSFLKKSDDKGMQRVYLFADGCSGQNKNSVVASTLLYVINNSRNIIEIVLRFSVPCHGQSEGDSAHSAIAHALKKAGDIFIPSQLIPIFKLARRNKPYEVIKLDYADFLNFKKIAVELRLLTIRKDDTGKSINWTEMMEYAVLKPEPGKLFFKTSHADTVLRSLSLKRQVSACLHEEIPVLNLERPKISVEKYNDLMSLTSGNTPVIRSSEFIEFYRSLSH